MFFQVDSGFTLDLQFKPLFEIENHPEHEECVYDYLKVSFRIFNIK